MVKVAIASLGLRLQTGCDRHCFEATLNRLFPLPAYTPQLQPTECIWPILREAVANRVFELETALVNRCCWLMAHPDVLIGHVGFDWIQAI